MKRKKIKNLFSLYLRCFLFGFLLVFITACYSKFNSFIFVRLNDYMIGSEVCSALIFICGFICIYNCFAESVDDIITYYKNKKVGVLDEKENDK